MSTEKFPLVLVDQYGGLVTLIDRSDLPNGVSPDCQNVEFFPGGVRSRLGLSQYSAPGAGEINGLHSMIDTVFGRHILVLGSAGEIRDGTATIAWGDVSGTTTALTTAQRMRGTNAFGRAFFSTYRIVDPAFPVPTPQDFVAYPSVGVLQYDGERLRAVAQDPPTASFTVSPSAGGTMSAGRHDFVVCYQTSTDYITPPSRPVGNTFTAGQDCDLAGIPVGPGYVVRRVIFATPANSTQFFTLPRFTIHDNSTTSVSGLTFTDAELMAGASLEDFADNVPLGASLGVEKYGERLVYWGMRPAIKWFFDSDATTLAPVVVGLTGLTFSGRDGALDVEWVTTGAGGSIVSVPGLILQGYRITGDGISATRGQIDQVAYNYANSGVRFIRPNSRYGLRVYANTDGMSVKVEVRVSATNVAGSGTLVASALLGNLPGYTDYFRWWDGGSILGGVDGQYVNIRVYADGTPALGAIATIGRIEIYEVSTDNQQSVLSVSQPGDPETVNGATGVISVAATDGQIVMNVFALRGNLYAVKDGSLYVTTDNGDDPVNWPIDIVSSTVGAVSPNAVGLGDGWAVIASKTGLYMFSGGQPEKISQEIQPTWDAINWGAALGLWVVVDPYAQRIYIGAPTGASATVNTIYMLDYVEGFGDPISSGGSGRKWTYWTIPARAAVMMDDGDTRKQIFTVGTSAKLARQEAGVYADLNVAFSSYYETAPVGSELGRSLFDRLIIRVRGAGTLTTQSRSPGGTLTTLTSKTLEASPDNDLEIRFHGVETQLGFRIGTSGATDYWSLRRLGAFFRPSEYSYLRKS